jgi:hypothetical protein
MIRNIMKYWDTRNVSHLPEVSKRNTVGVATCIAKGCYLCDPKHLRPIEDCPYRDDEWVY